jgi:hypothetical protein
LTRSASAVVVAVSSRTASLKRSASSVFNISRRRSGGVFSGASAAMSKRFHSIQLGPPLIRSGSTL